jgi:hypothetical protein
LVVVQKVLNREIGESEEVVRAAENVSDGD